MNLDALPTAELQAFWESTRNQGLSAQAVVLFPRKPTGYLRATFLLHKYALHTLEARRHRLDGKNQAALDAEQHADKVYELLPTYAAW